MASNTRICIVGGSGFVGSSLALHFSRKHEVVVLDVKPVPRKLEGRVPYFNCDVRNFEELSKFVSDVDLVVHAAVVQIPLINQRPELGFEVNFSGTINVCRAVEASERCKGMILTGSWHVFGERELQGVIDEGFGFRPDKVEDRARRYALSKIAQEVIVRYFNEMSEKAYGVVRLGTVLGEGMPGETAASIFIERGIKEGVITPYKHSMYRPMLYVDVKDVCTVFEKYADLLLSEGFEDKRKSVVNLFYPEPVTIIELAEIVRECIIELSGGKIRPRVEIVDKGLPVLYEKEDKERMQPKVDRLKDVLGVEELTHPKDSIRSIVARKLEELREGC